MAQKKAGGTTKNGRDSIGRRLGLKKSDGQSCKAGSILVRQRGTKFHAGDNVGVGRDHTLIALIPGVVSFMRRKNDRVYVGVKQVAESLSMCAVSSAS